MNRAVIFLFITFGLLNSENPAKAENVLVKGAVFKPRRFKIRLPFPCGVKARINCGYGPKCSKAHKRVRNVFSTNDYYALDMIRLEHNNGYDKPVVAVAPGIVRYAGWTKRRWSPYGKIVYIEHFFLDRHQRRYQTLYAHLNRVSVKVGQRVQAGAIIGTLGGSGKRRLLRYGAHLHFALYAGAGQRLGGGRAVLPEPLGAYRGLTRGLVMTACTRPEKPLVLRQAPDTLWSHGGLDLKQAHLVRSF